MRRISSAVAILSLAMAVHAPVWSGGGKTPEELSDDPDVERRLMDLPADFEMQLVASEPDVINPLQMNFDTRGRLWVVCAPRYPQLLPGQTPEDYVVVLDDFGPTGKARSAKVFAKGLTIPTGLAPGDGGVYVGQADSLLHFRDTKGTGQADERRVVLAGFGTQDTHHTLNTFRWSPDGALYFNQGVYIKSTVETPHGPRRLFGGGIWQLRTGGLKLEVFDRSILDNNTWGHVFDPWGQSFVASAWPNDINLVLPDSPLQKGEDRALIPPLKLTRVGGGRHCGLEQVSGRHFPDDWQGNLLTGDFLTHRVQRYRLTDNGQRFTATPLPPLVTSRHRKFRPIDIKMGPDGAIYVADLYQQIIQHNQIDFRDPRRDHTHGRIWRIVRKDRPLVPIPQLVDAPVSRVLDHLRDPEAWTRLHARRALAERDRRKVLAGLADWVRKPEIHASDAHLLEALWTYQALDEVQAPLLTRLLRSNDPRVRAAATRVLGAWADRLDQATRLLAAQAADPSVRVRLEAVLAAARVPSTSAVEAAFAALDQPSDTLVELALRKTGAILKPYWYPDFQAGRLTFGGKAKALAFALESAQAANALPALAELVKAGKVPADNQAQVLSLLAFLGDANHQALVLDQALASDRLPALDRVRLLEALAQAARDRPVRPGNDPDRIGALFNHPDLNVSTAAVRLAGAWKLEKLRSALNGLAEADQTLLPRRRAAISALVDLGGPDSARRLETLAGTQRPYATRVEALQGLAALDLKKAARLAVPLLSLPVQADQDPGGLYTAFLQRAGGPATLAQALKDQPPSADSARIGLRVITSLGVQAPALQATLQTAAGEAGKGRLLDGQGLRRLIKQVESHGDAARGEAIYRRSALGCVQCHAIAGAGGRVGPDLATLGASAPLDYLIESILLPSKVIKEGYSTAHVITKDGKALSGIVLRESPRELVLRDPTRDEIVIPSADIEERNAAGSLMPAGLDASLTDAELANLVRFLSELGRPGPFALTHQNIARRWRRLPSIPPALLALEDQALGKALIEEGFVNWTPAYSLVSGHLPLSEQGDGRGGPQVARCLVDVASPGKLLLIVNDAQGLKMWVDGVKMDPQARMTLTLPRGLHTLDFYVAPGAEKDRRLRCELIVPNGSGAEASFVAGR